MVVPSPDVAQFNLTLGVRPLSWIFRKKTPDRTWLCAGISPLLYRSRTW